ncbi:MAG: succinate dehydrogenase, hydrophobic membrane anchor protein [Ardenticatenales bacterium]|nr:succinate dehydrogenase, hydrophobic membrane anchor protein [Ardenticatenales bacterium]
MRKEQFRSAAGRMERSSDFELYMWFFMRVSGIILLFIALFHLYYMHFVVDVAETTFFTIAERWQNPLWRTFDLALLFFSFTHGTNGVRYVLEDYIRHPGMRVAAKTGLYLLYGVLLAMGTYVIFAFDADKWMATKEQISALLPLFS